MKILTQSTQRQPHNQLPNHRSFSLDHFSLLPSRAEKRVAQQGNRGQLRLNQAQDNLAVNI